MYGKDAVAQLSAGDTNAFEVKTDFKDRSIQLVLYGNLLISAGLTIGALYLQSDPKLVYADQIMSIFIAFYMILTSFSMIYDSIISIMDDDSGAASAQQPQLL